MNRDVMEGGLVKRRSQGSYRGKRILDLSFAVGGLALLAPLLILIAIAVRASDGGPSFFRQLRVGEGGRLFRMWKFRTMVVNAQELGGPLTLGADSRITPCGRFLRRLKLDELPQLLNVMLGDMSLVGPRPEVPAFVEYYNPAQRGVLDLRPGITDPASVIFWNESELLACAEDPIRYYVGELLPQKLTLTMAYAEVASLGHDLWVVLATAAKAPSLLRRCGLPDHLLRAAVVPRSPAR